MIIKKIKIKNFMGYKEASVDIDESTGGKKLVVFVGENGQGKTSMLFALVFGLTGFTGLMKFIEGKEENDYTSGLSKQGVKELEWINDGFWDLEGNALDSNVSCSVELEFELMSKTYVLTRTYVGKMESPKRHYKNFQETINLKKVGGEEFKQIDAEYWVEKNMPSYAARFFMVDGEDVQKYSYMRDTDVQKAIKNILGLPAVKYAGKLLEKRSKKYNDEINRLAVGDEKIERNKHGVLVREWEALKGELESAKLKVDGYEEDFKVADQKLVDATAESGGWNKVRNKEARLRELDLESMYCYEDIQKTIATGSLARSLIKDLYEDQIEMHDVPMLKRLSKEMSECEMFKGAYNTVLSNGDSNCICGQHVDEKTRDDLEKKLADIDRDIRRIRKERNEAEEYTPTSEELKEGYSRMEGEDPSGIDIIKLKYKNLNSIKLEKLSIEKSLEIETAHLGKEVNTKSLMRTRDKARDVMERNAENIKSLQNPKDGKIILKEREAKKQEKTVNDVTKITTKKTTLIEKKKRVENFEKVFGELLSSYASSKKAEVEKYMLEMYKKVRNDDMDDLYCQLSIDENYSIIKKWTGTDGVSRKRRMSAGYNQLVAMSLIYGLCKSTMKKIPLVLDFPFGRLDSGNSKRLCNWLCDMDGMQVFLLVTDEEYERRRTELESSSSISYDIHYDKEKGSSFKLRES